MDSQHNGWHGQDGHLTDDSDEDQPSGGGWVRHGGTLHWEEAEAEEQQSNFRAEAESRWAEDDVDLPLGAPSAARVRATRAWLLRQRLEQQEALGRVLLARRSAADEDDADEADEGLELALVEFQAASDEYEALLEALATLGDHNGPDRILVEFHLHLTERLLELASAAEAPADFDPGVPLLVVQRQPGPRPTPTAAAAWRGRVDAVQHARRRVEYLTAPETND